MNKPEVNHIGTIDFRDVKVQVYNDPYMTEDDYSCCWQARSPESYYQGLVYMGADGKITYPKDAVIPKQTPEDREMLPKFIITGREAIDDKLREDITEYLKWEYIRRNTK